MNIEELRKTWQRASFNAVDLNDDNRRIAEELATGQAQSTQKKLYRYYRRASIQALALPVLAPMLDMPLWITAVYALFGLVMAALLSTFSRSIRSIDLASIPVVAALELSIDIKRKQRMLRCFGMSSGILIAMSMFFFFIDHENSSLIWGFIVGAVIGVIIGLKRYMNANRLIRQLQEELQSAEQELR